MRKLVAAAILWPAAALAGGYAIPNENARDLALGQAAVAAQTGPEAVFQNTAALAGQRGFSVSGSLEMLDNKTSWDNAVLGSSSTRSHPNYPPAFSLAYGGQLGNGMAWGVGAGAYVPAGGSLYWPDHWAGATRIQSVSQQTVVGRAGVALQPIEHLKVGAAFVYYQVTEKFVQQINYLSSESPASLGLAGGAPSFAVSAEFQIPGRAVTIGVDYRQQGDVTLKGKAHFEGVPAAFASQLQDQGVTSKTTVPSELFVGFAYQVDPQLKVMAAYTLEGWSVYKSDTFVGDKGFTVTVPRRYRDAWAIGAGVEYQKIPQVPALTLRAGMLRSFSDQPLDTVSPSLSDGKSWAASVGAGYQVLPGLRVDLAYQHAWFDPVSATGIEAFPGTYKTTADLVSLGLSWRKQD
jgi:long-chain fatty acid transport protein